MEKYYYMCILQMCYQIECFRLPVVFLSHTRVEPLAVVVEVQHALVTVLAVLTRRMARYKMSASN